MGLSEDAWNLLAWGQGDRTVPWVPDGPRHYDAVQELLALGFVKYSSTCLVATDAGRIYYEANRAPN